ncbi:MAG TPA: hypothetical protein VNH17_06430 [Streptosporangiaceae bacterium]|nr:hypothetical protein [Streptosporangiaceae bacterium]
MASPLSPVTVHVTTAGGRVAAVPPGGRLVFGRGPDVDLVVPAGRGLSRRAGLISAVEGGGWVANLSSTHALYTEGDGYRIRLPRLDEGGEPSAGWFVREGSILVGSRAMLDDGQPLRLVVAAADGAAPVAGDVPGGDLAGGAAGNGAAADGALDARYLRADGDVTLLPLYLDPNTKLFLVALMWCRPWLIDPGRSTALPRTPEIARAALECTDAHHEIERFDTDPAFRDRLSARVGEHLKVLRRKIVERGLVRPGTRLSDEVAVGALIENGIVAPADLARLSDPAWCSRQEDLWWTQTG